MKICFLNLLITVLFPFFTKAQEEGSFKIINLSNNTVSAWEDLRIVKLPEFLIDGFWKDNTPDISFIICRKVNSKFMQFSPSAEYDILASVLGNRKYIEVKKGDSVNHTLDLDFFYSKFKKGSYKMKIQFRISNFNKNYKDVESKWFYFTVSKDLT
jgi:hypothetical protein